MYHLYHTVLIHVAGIWSRASILVDSGVGGRKSFNRIPISKITLNEIYNSKLLKTIFFSFPYVFYEKKRYTVHKIWSRTLFIFNPDKVQILHVMIVILV